MRFQAAQALAFDLLTMSVMFILFFCVFGVIFAGVFGTMFAGLNSAAQPENFTWLMLFPALLPFGMVSCIFPFAIALFVTRMVAAVAVLNGNNFHYPWLGTRVENFLTG